ncbi:cobalamin biosynthesis protein [Amorphus sp. 3PC139-8]|uniref:cobalamin biosynthesis protein n=1 Tax=Amorphus sp. 3PC139-8 TaxID=2735676 RepID=UPI00345DAEEA
MIAAGIGLRDSANASELAALYDQACALAGISSETVGCLATLAQRAVHPAVQTLAARHGLPVRSLSDAELQAADARVATRSARIEARHGVGSVAEAAALAAAGPNAALILPRITSPAATCALARSEP